MSESGRALALDKQFTLSVTAHEDLDDPLLRQQRFHLLSSPYSYPAVPLTITQEPLKIGGIVVPEARLIKIESSLIDLAEAGFIAEVYPVESQKNGHATLPRFNEESDEFLKNLRLQISLPKMSNRLGSIVARPHPSLLSGEGTLSFLFEPDLIHGRGGFRSLAFERRHPGVEFPKPPMPVHQLRELIRGLNRGDLRLDSVRKWVLNELPFLVRDGHLGKVLISHGEEDPSPQKVWGSDVVRGNLVMHSVQLIRAPLHFFTESDRVESHLAKVTA